MSFDLGISRERVDEFGRKAFVSIKLRGMEPTASDDEILSLLGRADRVRGLVIDAMESWGLSAQPAFDVSAADDHDPELQLLKNSGAPAPSLPKPSAAPPISLFLRSLSDKGVTFSLDPDGEPRFTGTMDPADVKTAVDRRSEVADWLKQTDRMLAEAEGRNTLPVDKSQEPLHAPANVDPSASETPDESRPVPAADEVTEGALVFGVAVPIPPIEWHRDPITQTGGASGRGQIVAINAALTSAGYKMTARHVASQAILAAFGPLHEQPVNDHVTSMLDLSKAEAHIVLSFLEGATPESLAQLGAQVKRQEVCRI